MILTDTSAYSAGATTSQMFLQGLGSTSVNDNLVGFTAQATASRYSNLVIETSNGSGGAATALTLTGAATPLATFPGSLAVTSSSQFNSTLNLGGSNSLNSAANRLQFTTAGAVARGQIQHSRIATGDIQILSSDSANITLVPSGGTVIIDGALTVGAITASGLPTSDPSVANQLWNDSGTVKISAG